MYKINYSTVDIIPTLLTSSNISEGVYHPSFKILDACFHSGHVYRYTSVHNHIFNDLTGLNLLNVSIIATSKVYCLRFVDFKRKISFRKPASDNP